MTLSPREREVLETVSRCGSVAMSALALTFEERMPEDELQVIVDSLCQKALVGNYAGTRSSVVTITRAGEREANRA